MAQVQGDQSVLTLGQLMEHEEAVIVAEINDKPVIFKLSELLGKTFLKESVNRSDKGLNMRYAPIADVGELRPVAMLVMNTRDGKDQDVTNFYGYGWIVSAIADGNTPAISVGTTAYGEPQKLITKSGITGAPSFVPYFIGQIIINTSKDIYMSTGLTAADWKKISP